MILFRRLNFGRLQPFPLNYKAASIGTLILLVAITLFAMWRIPNLNFNYEFESYFPVDDPDLIYYQGFREVFESDNDFLLIGLVNNQGVFQKKFLQQLDSFSQDLSKLNHITNLRSPTNLANPVIGLLGVINVPYLHVNSTEKYTRDSLRIFESKQLVGTFFAKNTKAVSILAKVTEQLSKAAADSLVNQMEKVCNKYTFDELHIAGRIKGQHYYINKMQSEMVKFIAISLTLLILFLFFSFRSFWGIWVPIIVVMVTAIWLLSIMELLGKPINVITTLLPCILFVVGVSDVVHIVSKYLEELRTGQQKIDALKTAFREVGMATLLTSITTAVGFLTLLTASIHPIREFGLFTAVGVFLAFILAFTLLPSVLYLIKTPKIAQKQAQNIFWYGTLRILFRWTLVHRKMILVAFTIIIAACCFYIPTIKIDNFLLEDLANDDPQRQDFEFFEEHFSAVRPFEMVVWFKNGEKVFDYASLQILEEIENYLKESYGTDFIISPLFMVKKTCQAMNGGQEKNFRFPKSETELKKIIRIVNKISKKEIRKYVSPGKTAARISGRIVDIGGNAIAKKGIELDAFMKSTFKDEDIGYKLTGTALLIDKNNEYLAFNLLHGLLIAFGLIALIVGLLYRSVSMVLISLIPNVFPLLMIAGIMGAVGIDLKVSTSIIFTIAFGIAVDDTIHFLSKLKIELAKGKSLLYALKRTYISTGKAICVTTLILCSGFLSLILASFTSIYYIGLLISLTLLFAVAADLLLLPVLLLFFYRMKEKKS